MATDPICGMFVDERTAELVLHRENRSFYFCSTACLEEFSAPERQLARLRLKLAVGWPLAVAVLILSYTHPFPTWPWVALLLAAIVQFYPGLQFYRGTYDAVRSRVWNMDILIAVGTTTAFGFSAAAVLLPAHLPAIYYFDASALIVVLILTGNYLEHLTRERARGSLRKLRELLPSTAVVLRDGVEVTVPLSELQVGDRFRVRAGGKFPTDGVVTEGRTSVDESLLTGESRPVAKGPGVVVLGGSINGEGVVTVEAKQVGEDTLLAQIGHLVAEAETSRVPLQQLADRIAAIFVPLVLVLALAVGFGWFAAGTGGTIALLAFVSVAITACPCAFGIATPAALLVGTGRAAERGVLFKGRDSLERASRIDRVLTDKTGTLTRGMPALTECVSAEGFDRSRLLAIAAGLEEGSEHPLARAVLEAARKEGVAREPVQDIQVDAGRGIRGRWRGHSVDIALGTLDDPGLARATELRTTAERLQLAGRTWSVMSEEGRPIGLLGFDDPLAPGVPQAVRELGSDAIEVVMVTGDQDAVARRIGREAGIGEIHARVSPAGKLELIREAQRAGHRVAYVGDGINDAPALAAADLGIAIGAGTDVAKETGGVILVRSDFEGVPLALRAGRRTVGKVRGNLAWALGYNAVLLPIAAGALVPLFGLSVFNVLPITGALAMGLSSTSVVLNSLALRLDTPRRPISGP